MTGVLSSCRSMLSLGFGHVFHVSNTLSIPSGSVGIAREEFELENDELPRVG